MNTHLHESLDKLGKRLNTGRAPYVGIGWPSGAGNAPCLP